MSANGTAQNDLVGKSTAAARLRQHLEEAAEDHGSIWLMGAEGTGKEFAARIINRLKGIERSRLVKVRCSDLSQQNFDEVLLGKDEEWVY